MDLNVEKGAGKNIRNFNKSWLEDNSFRLAPHPTENKSFCLKCISLSDVKRI